MMEKKNVLFWVAVRDTSENMRKRHGDYKYFEYSHRTWKHWCDRHGVIFFPYTENNRGAHPQQDLATWTRWFDLFPLLDQYNIPYNKICAIDASTMVRWDAPNFFDDVPDSGLTVYKSQENLKWVYEGVTGYADMFPDVEFDLKRYFTCGFQVFTAQHREFLETLEKFYRENWHQILKYQHEKVGRGTDQPVYNYLAQREELTVNLNAISREFWVTHMPRFEWLGHNWQLAKEFPDRPEFTIPHFIKYAYVWVFSGMADRSIRNTIMAKLWSQIEPLYATQNQ